MCDTYSEFAKLFTIYFIGGVLIGWTFTEYYYHRFSFHRENELDPSKDADPDFLEQIFVSHLHHHVFMNQWSRIGLKLDLALKVIFPTQLILHMLLPIPCVLLLISALAFGGMVYDGIHLAFHFNWNLNWIFPGFQRMKDQHMRHHFRDNSKEFGVTTNLWDIVYGTTKVATKNL